MSSDAFYITVHEQTHKTESVNFGSLSVPSLQRIPLYSTG